ncbi:MAG: TIGR01777 family oxidoreductase [Candidatus Zixiibacteriota bacterium]
MRVLISGSSGFIGQALTDTLLAHGHEPIALKRTTGKVSSHTVVWEPIARGTWDSDIGDVDAVVNLAGANLAARRWSADFQKIIRESRITGTTQLCCHLASLNRRPSVLISASATGYYGHRGDEVLTEDSTPGRGFLCELCHEWESASAPAKDAGIRVVNPRIGVVLARHGGALAKMLPIFRLGLGGKLGSGKQWMSWVTLSDLLEIILRAISDQTLSGPVNAVAPNPVTNTEFTRQLGHVLRRPALLPAPAFALRVALGPMADEALLSSARVQPQKLQGVRHNFQHSDVAAALQSVLTAQK